MTATRYWTWSSSRGLEWARRLGASPPMRMTASWFRSSRISRIQVCAKCAAPLDQRQSSARLTSRARTGFKATIARCRHQAPPSIAERHLRDARRAAPNPRQIGRARGVPDTNSVGKPDAANRHVALMSGEGKLSPSPSLNAAAPFFDSNNLRMPSAPLTASRSRTDLLVAVGQVAFHLARLARWPR